MTAWAVPDLKYASLFGGGLAAPGAPGVEVGVSMSNRYVQIICTACGGKIVAVVGQARPSTCPLCKEPLEHLVAPTKAPARQTDSTTRAPATFTRGTFTSRIPVTPSGATAKPQKNSGDLSATVSDLKDKLKRLFRA
jgi:hypothetical protein